ncbi:MAG: anthranilate synthase component I [Firmicutes bacterium HGW-Firmicutes-7]|nr:MAG: anthranilate synthase component I [Firmicutes bacterium HGW-Firmicutes-7]
MEKKLLKTYVETMIGDTETPITLYQKYVRKGEGFLLESKEQPKGRYSFLATNPFIVVKAHGNQIDITSKGKTITKKGKALEEVKRIVEEYDILNDTKLPFVGGAVGTVGYDTIKQYEKIPAENIDSIGTPDVHLMFVKEGIAYDHFNHTIYIIALEEDNDQGKEIAEERIYEIKMMLKKDIIFEEDDEESEKLIFQSNVSKKTYEEAVERAKSYIYEGDIFQVVLSQRWSARCETSPFTLYRRLRRLNPSPYMYYFRFDDYYIVGSSPEMLVELKEDKISNCPIAGTRRRGKTEEEDKLLAEDLMGDEKEIAEHIMLVDLGRNDMGKVSKIGSVKVTKYMEVQNYSHVMHIVSVVEGDKREDQDMFQVLMSFLPAGTLSGAPKIRAMEIIEELEISKRGIYGGAIGYFGFNQTMDMCIAIRTMVIKDDVVHIQAGAGIVADSVPEVEYEETRNKAQALISAINN